MLKEHSSKLWSNKLKKYTLPVFLFALMMVGLVSVPAVVAAGNERLPEEKKTSDKTLHITSDKLISDRNSSNIIFTGNVNADYGGTTITADELNVTYIDDAGHQPRVSEEKIDKIIATGHVTIKFDKKTAYCDRAVYTAKTKTILLTGTDSRIQSGDNYITGDKITIEQSTGQIIVEGKPEKRVNAVFKPEKNSVEPFGKKNNTLPK